MLNAAVQSVRRFLRDESGPTAVEYCVMVMLILLVCITAVQLIGRALNDNWTGTSSELNKHLGN